MTTSNDFRKSLDEIRTTADEVRVKLHLASLEARTTWERLEPQIVKLERAAEAGGREAAGTIVQMIDDVGKAVRKLRDQLVTATRG
jgi:hypothetical protein